MIHHVGVFASAFARSDAFYRVGIGEREVERFGCRVLG